MSITIPWMNLQANTTRFHINGIYLLIVPKNGNRLQLTLRHLVQIELALIRMSEFFVADPSVIHTQQSLTRSFLFDRAWCRSE